MPPGKLKSKMIHPLNTKDEKSSRHYVTVNNTNGMGFCSKCHKEYTCIRNHVMSAHGIDPLCQLEVSWQKKYPFIFYAVYALVVFLIAYNAMNFLWPSLIIDVDPSVVPIGEKTEVYITGQMDESSLICFVPEYLNVPSMKIQRICAVRKFFFCPHSTRIPCPNAITVAKRRVTVLFPEFGDFRVCPMVNHLIDCSDNIKIRARHP